MGQWAKPKKLSWQRKRRRELAADGFCTGHPLIQVVEGHNQCAKCLDQKRRATNKRRLNLKIKTFEAYGSICSCCSEYRIEFLTLEHSRGDGGKHRKAIGVRAGIWFYAWLQKNRFPQDLGLTVHCFNCNCAKGQYGYCPHDRERRR